MASERVGDMTIDELKALIGEVVEQRLKGLETPKSERSREEVLASIKRNRWTPPPGSRSTLELLREDRDS